MLPFSPPRSDEKIVEAVAEVLRSGWISTGPKAKLFEQKITAYCGNKVTLCTSAATTGLELILRWFGIKEGDEVIVPAYTYCATANVVVHCGAKPVLVDVGPDFNITVEAIEKAITPKTKAVMPVDIGGFPCNYDEINALIRREDVVAKFQPGSENQQKLGRMLVLSDSAHSFGAFYKKKQTGSLTDVSVFSFHAVKNLSTAEGGAVALNLSEPFENQTIYSYLNTMSLHGQSKDALAKVQKGGWRYDVIDAGYKCNMMDIQAAMGLVELERYDSETLKRRKEIFDAYAEGLSKYDWAQIPVYETKEKTSSYHVFLLRIKDISEVQRDEIMQEIFNQKVAVNVHFQPLPLLTAYKSRGYNISDFPVAYDNYSREITLPVYYDLTDQNVQTVINAVVNAVEKVEQPA
ncbi:MAG: capsular biosynthesis protein [Flavobacteriales bacterium]|nr:MAG: capsular biosynthesis protein [Flavobacteriales bacterium]